MHHLAKDHYSARGLKETHRTPLSTLKKRNQSYRNRDSRLEDYIKENHQLRIKCQKIDQIEKYVHVLIEQNENFKTVNGQLQKQNLELIKQIDSMKGQVIKLRNIKSLKEEALRIQSEKRFIKPKSQFYDNFQLIRLRQEFVSQRQKHDQILKIIDSKHRQQLFKQDHEQQLLKNTQIKLAEQSMLLAKENQSLLNQNSKLCQTIRELTKKMKMLGMEDEKVSIKVNNYKILAEQAQNEVNLCGKMINQIETENIIAIQSIGRQLEMLKIQLSKSQNEISMLEKINNQLKQQNSLLISEKAGLKQTILSLQQTKYSLLKQIEKVQSELRMLVQATHFLENQIRSNQAKYKQCITILENVNAQLRQLNHTYEKDAATKTHEIHDLINMVSQLENNQKATSSSLIQMKKENSILNQRLLYIQSKMQDQVIEIDMLSVNWKQSQKFAVETEKNCAEVRKKLAQLEVIYQNEKKKLKQFNGILQLESQKRRILEMQKQHLLKELVQKQMSQKQNYNQISQDERQCLVQNQNNSISQQKIFSLQSLVNSLKVKITGDHQLFERQRQDIMAKLEAKKQKIIKEGLNNMEKVVSDKYENMLKQKDDYFKEKIKFLQNQIVLLQNPSAQASQQCQ